MHIVDWHSSADHPGLRTARPGPTGIEWALWSLEADSPPARWCADDATPIEAGAVVMTGCHDLQAGSGSWHSRGVRQTPGDGKPVAVYLPPKAQFAALHGEGEVLVVSSPQTPAKAPAEPAEPRQKPLLPMAGSNKAYNPATGTWDPIESFPDSPEAVPPRRMPITECGGASWVEIFPRAFKAADLSLAETVLGAGEWPLPELGGDRESAIGLYLRPLDGAVSVTARGDSDTVEWTSSPDDGDLVVHCPAGSGAQPTVESTGPVYVLLAEFGKLLE